MSIRQLISRIGTDETFGDTFHSANPVQVLKKNYRNSPVVPTK
jgi:hypothetical protein